VKKIFLVESYIYDKHYEEIEELRAEYKESTGEPLQIKNDLRKQRGQKQRGQYPLMSICSLIGFIVRLHL